MYSYAWAPGVQGTGGGGTCPSRFCEANVKSLILTIGAPPDLYIALPVLLMCPPSFHSHRAPMFLCYIEVADSEYITSFAQYCSSFGDISLSSNKSDNHYRKLSHYNSWEYRILFLKTFFMP